MRRAMLAAGLAALIALAGCAHSSTADADRAAIATLLDAFLAGASVNDAEMHDRFWSDELIYTSSAGERFGKAAIMDGLATAEPGPGDTVYSAQDVDIRLFGDTAALTFRLVATADDAATTHYLNSGTLRRVSGRWQVVVWQATKEKMPPAPDGPASNG